MADGFSSMLETSMGGGGGLKSPFATSPEMPDPKKYREEGERMLKDAQEARRPFIEKQEANITRMFELAKELKAREAPEAPKLQDMPQAPDTKYRDPTQALGSMATVLAVIGSMKTRAPLTSALSSAAAAMQGFQKGDQQRVKLEREKYHDSMESALRQNNIELQKYTASLQRHKFDLEKARPEFEAIAAENEHNAMLAATQSGDLKMMFQIYDNSKKIEESMVRDYTKYVEFMIRQDEVRRQHKETAQYRRDMLAARGSAGGHSAGGPKDPLDDGGLKEQIALARAGMQSAQVVKGWGKDASQRWNKVVSGAIEQIMDENPGVTKNDAGRMFATEQLGYKANSAALNQNTKDLASIRPFERMLKQNVDIAVDLSKKTVLSDSKFANKTLNWIKQNVGDNPDANEYLAQMRIVQTEAARVLNNPRLVGQLTDTARKEMEDVVNGNMPINSTERVLRRVQNDGERRVREMEKEHERLLRGNVTSGTDQPKIREGNQSWTTEKESRYQELLRKQANGSD